MKNYMFICTILHKKSPITGLFLYPNPKPVSKQLPLHRLHKEYKIHP